MWWGPSGVQLQLHAQHSKNETTDVREKSDICLTYHAPEGVTTNLLLRARPQPSASTNSSIRRAAAAAFARGLSYSFEK